VQVFVCSVKCAVYIKVSYLCARTSRSLMLVIFHILDMSSARRNRGQHRSPSEPDYKCRKSQRAYPVLFHGIKPTLLASC
jgi:hypothetical protein